MTSLTRFLFDQARIVFIAVTCVNATLWWCRGRSARLGDPSLEDGYRSLIKDFLLWANLPWIAMGVPVLGGLVPSTTTFIQPQSRSPYVLGWYILWVATWVFETHWVVFQGGAEKLLEHPGLLRVKTSSPVVVKTLSVLGLVAGALGVFVFQFSGWLGR